MTDWSPPRTPRGQVSRVPQMPGLDGMRALAVVAVMVYHADKAWLHGGFLGVEVFFVISGYLITLLLIAEHERSGYVDLKQFWLRRFRRLLPPLIVMLGLLAIYVAVGYERARGRTRGDIVGGLSYLSNWYQIWVGAGYTASEAFAPLRHLWSLAVEEQFYVVWPLVMIAVLRRGRSHLPRVAMWLLGIVAAITVVTALVFVPGDIDSTCSPEASHGWWRLMGRCISIDDTLYLGTFSRAGGLLLGAALAMLWRPMAILRGPLRRRGHLLDVLAAGGLALLAWLMWHTHLADPARTMLTGSRFDPTLFRGGLLLTGIATVFVIMAVSHERAWTGKLLGNPVCSWVGTRSYGLYLYHWPIYQIIRREAGLALEPWQFVLALAITVPITELSYRVVEIPIRQGRIGAWLRSPRRSRPSATVLRRRRAIAGLGVVSVMVLGFAGVSIAMAPNRCLGTVECANEEGADAIAAQAGDVPSAPGDVGDLPAGTTTTTTTDAGPPTGGSAVDDVAHTLPPDGSPAAAGSTVPVTAPPTTAPAPILMPPIAVGESVMLGAVTQLQSGGFTVYAQESKQGTWVAQVIGQLRAAGQIGSTIVIQTGTNGPVSAETYQQIMSFLPPSDVPTVVFLTVHADRGWIGRNNELIRALPSQYPNVQVLEWDGLVSSGAIPGIANDGIHLGTRAAKQTYANYIFDVIGRRDLVRPIEG